MNNSQTLHPSLLDRLRSQHESIPVLLSYTDADRVLIRPAQGKWNIKDNLAHLGRYQHIFENRLNRILAEAEPEFGRYIAEADNEFETWRALTVEKLLENMMSDRKKLIDRIAQFDSKELTRIGVHPKYGRLNVTQWTEFFLLHEAHHIFAIFQLAHDTAL